MTAPDDTARSRCHDCRRDVIVLGHCYMVRDDIWALTGLGPADGVLCLACLQGRIGRWLRADDFRLTDEPDRDGWGGARMVPRVWRDRWTADGRQK